MKRIISKCPTCDGTLQISTLTCPDCGTEIKNSFELSAFDKLSGEQGDFLLEFLKSRGNLKDLQANLGISYPTAKKKLDNLLAALDLAGEEAQTEEGEIDMTNLTVNRSSTKASEIIKAKLFDNGGRAIVHTFRGEPRQISISNDGKFLCPQLVPYDFEIFDAIVDLLLRSPGYRAKKGNARNFKLGEPGCEESTVAGTILVYLGVKPGRTGYDPAFLLCAVLEWAGIATNGRGVLSLNNEYRRLL